MADRPAYADYDGIMPVVGMKWNDTALFYTLSNLELANLLLDIT